MIAWNANSCSKAELEAMRIQQLSRGHEPLSLAWNPDWRPRPSAIFPAPFPFCKFSNSAWLQLARLTILLMRLHGSRMRRRECFASGGIPGGAPLAVLQSGCMHGPRPPNIFIKSVGRTGRWWMSTEDERHDSAQRRRAESAATADSRGIRKIGIRKRPRRHSCYGRNSDLKFGFF